MSSISLIHDRSVGVRSIHSAGGGGGNRARWDTRYCGQEVGTRDKDVHSVFVKASRRAAVARSRGNVLTAPVAIVGR